MADPITKKVEKRKDIIGEAMREGVALAIAKEKASIILDGRPCSIEIGRNAKGELSWNAKVYTIDAQEMLDSVKVIRKIEVEIKKQFE